MSKKNLALVFTLAAATLGLAACGESKDVGTTNPTTPQQTEQSGQETTPVQAIFTFEGKNTINNVEYACTLKGLEGNKIELKIGDAKTYTGTYAFVEGQGYEFTINGEKIKTTFDKETKNHVFTFTARLGSAGSGEVKLTLNDPDFVLKEKDLKKEFLEKAMFVGSGKYIVPGAGAEGKDKTEGIAFKLTFPEPGKYKIENEKLADLNYEGTYTFENNVFKLAYKDQTLTSTFNPLTGEYTIPAEFKNDLYTIPTTFSYNSYSYLNGFGISGVAEIMNMDFGLTVTVDGKGGAFFDAYCLDPFKAGMGGMNLNAMFDQRATYTFADNVYTFTLGEGENQTTHKTVYDEATKTYSMDYTLVGGNGSFDYKLTGSNLGKEVAFEGDSSINMGKDVPVHFIATINGEEALVRAICGFGDGKYNEDGSYTLGNFDRKGTAKVEGDVITITIDGNEFVSRFDEKTGSYVIDYTLSGGEATLTPTLSLSVWA